MVRAVDVVPRGHHRLETKFQYPDGSSVDLFVIAPAQPDLLPGPPLLSDLGQTTTWLADLQIRPWQSKKRQRFIEDIIHILKVRQNGGALEAFFEMEKASIEDAIIRLGQACVRTADLAFTRRASLQVNVADEVEEIISDAELPYEPDAQLPGRHGNVVLVDFLVSGRNQRSAVLTLASQYQASAHNNANEVFRKLYDLDTPGRSEQRVTVYDDRYDVYRNEDLQRIRGVSELVPLSARRDIVGLLAA